MNESKRYWFFLKKVHERLTILFQHNVPNKIGLEEADEQLYKEMYEWFCKSDLFSAGDSKFHDITSEQLSIYEQITDGTDID